MSEIRKTKLRIADVKSIVNHIASTYKELYRAAMEYIDNSIDAAYDEIEHGVKKPFWVNVIIDHDTKKLIFIDNCKGMTPEKLCGLVENIGSSEKKERPWLNGQFGFGVHAGRAFAKNIKFYSQIMPGKGATIEIDRDVDEHTEISCDTTDYLDNIGMEHGTVVEISHFNARVFNKKTIYVKLAEEIKKHFDDIIRKGDIKITIIEKVDGKEIPVQMMPFDYDSLEGVLLKRDIPIGMEGRGILNVELKIIEKPQKDRLVTIQNNGRRVSDLVEMRSIIQFYKSNNKNINLWRNQYLIGYIEVNGTCSPNITRDDFEPEEKREEMYSKIMELEPEIRTIIEVKLKNKNQDAYNKLGNVMSGYLENYLKKFKFEFFKPDQKIDKKGEESPIIDLAENTDKLQKSSGESGVEGSTPTPPQEPVPPEEPVPLEEPVPPEEPNPVLVENVSGNDVIGKGDGKDELPPIRNKGKETIQTKKSYGPIIKFRDSGPDADRVIDNGDILEINTLHPDFINRNEQKDGKIILGERLINYVAIIIAPTIIKKIYEKERQFPNFIEAGERTTGFIMGFEGYLIKNASPMVFEVENA